MRSALLLRASATWFVFDDTSIFRGQRVRRVHDDLYCLDDIISVIKANSVIPRAWYYNYRNKYFGRRTLLDWVQWYILTPGKRRMPMISVEGVLAIAKELRIYNIIEAGPDFFDSLKPEDGTMSSSSTAATEIN